MGIDHALAEGAGDGRIDGIAATPQDFGSDFGSLRLSRDDHSAHGLSSASGAAQ